MLAGLSAGGERAGAQRAARAPWRHGGRGVAEHERDQRGLERLQHIGGGHAEMVLRRTETALILYSRAIASASCMARVPTTKPNPFCPSRRGGDRRDALGFEHRARIDQAAAQAVDIACRRQRPGVDAAQVRAHEATGNGRGVGGGHAVGDESPRKSLRRGGLRIDAVGFGGSATFEAFAAANRLPFRRQTLGWRGHQS